MLGPSWRSAACSLSMRDREAGPHTHTGTKSLGLDPPLFKALQPQLCTPATCPQFCCGKDRRREMKTGCSLTQMKPVRDHLSNFDKFLLFREEVCGGGVRQPCLAASVIRTSSRHSFSPAGCTAWQMEPAPARATLPWHPHDCYHD